VQGGGEIIFSRLAPGSHIQSHCGPTNLRWTAHLGLIVPESAAENFKLRVSEEWHTWQEGKILPFDDSFEHEVGNDSEQERVVLLIRLCHSDLKANQRSSVLDGARTKKEKAVKNGMLLHPKRMLSYVGLLRSSLAAEVKRCDSDATIGMVNDHGGIAMCRFRYYAL